MNKKKKIILGSVIAVLIVLIVVLAITINHDVKKEPAKKTDNKNMKVEKYYSSVAGIEVDSKDMENSNVTAVMIENSPAARPQSGLAKADLVFEAVTEGGITRFSALFQTEKPELIGPVRSLRTHFFNLLTPFNCGIAHVGGSRSATSHVRKTGNRDLDQFFNSKYYWRSKDRHKPHNMYTNFEKLDALNNEKRYTTSDVKSLNRKQEDKEKDISVSKFEINFSKPLFNTYYEYDSNTNSYKRYMHGKPHEDRENGQIQPKVVVALMTNMKVITLDSNEPQVNAIGSGKAYIFQDGGVEVGTWEKGSAEDQIKLSDEEGNDISLNRGKTWISIVTEEMGSVRYTESQE